MKRRGHNQEDKGIKYLGQRHFPFAMPLWRNNRTRVNAFRYPGDGSLLSGALCYYYYAKETQSIRPACLWLTDTPPLSNNIINQMLQCAPLLSTALLLHRFSFKQSSVELGELSLKKYRNCYFIIWNRSNN